MSFAGLRSEKDRINLIAYLRSNADAPAAIPAPKPAEKAAEAAAPAAGPSANPKAGPPMPEAPKPH